MIRLLPLLLVFSIIGCSDDDVDPPVTTSDTGNDSESLADVGVDTAADEGGDMVDPPDMSGSEDMGSDGPPFMRGSLYESGEYKVGYTSFETSYDAVDEPGRTIRIAVWYPTRDEDGPASRYSNFISRAEAFRDASLAPDGPYPLVVFSHGNTSLPEQSFFMTEWLATHGFVVIAPEHTGNTFREASEGISFASAADRPQDVTAALDAFLALPQADALSGQTTDQIAMTGHSFGGYTTLAVMGASFEVDRLLEACRTGVVSAEVCASFSDAQVEAFRSGFEDDRFKVGLPQTPAGALFFGDGIAEIDRPMLTWTGGRDQTLPNAVEGDPIWAALVGPQWRIDIVNAGHFTFSNMCPLFGAISEQVANDGCNETFIVPEDAFEIVNAYSLAFLRKHFGETDEYDALLDGRESVFEAELRIQVKP